MLDELGPELRSADSTDAKIDSGMVWCRSVGIGEEVVASDLFAERGRVSPHCLITYTQESLTSITSVGVSPPCTSLSS